MGVDHKTVRLWAKGVYNPRNPFAIREKLSRLVVEKSLELVDDYYSDTHGGPPNHLFELKPGESPPIKRFKRMIKEIADMLDTYNREWIEEATRIGLDYLIKFGEKLPKKKIASFVVACYRVAALRLYRRYLDWDDKLQFFITINPVKNEDYDEYMMKLSKYLGRDRL